MQPEAAIRRISSAGHHAKEAGVAQGAVFWAGKNLSAEEERSLRDLVALLRRTGTREMAENFERFLPENADRWTPDELEMGAHVGPWLAFDARVANGRDGC
jgi:hypothetical protein